MIKLSNSEHLICFFEYFVINKHIEYWDTYAKDKYEKWKTNYHILKQKLTKGWPSTDDLNNDPFFN